MQYIIPIVILFVLIYVNSFFASAEIALLSLNKNKLQKSLDDGDKSVAKLIRLTNDSSSFLSTIQIAITLSGFVNSAIAADNFSEPITNGLISLGLEVDFKILNTIVIILITLLLSYFNLVFGELVPKRIAMQKPLEMAKKSCGVVLFVAKITKPFVKLLSVSQNFILKLLHYRTDDIVTEVTEDDIQLMIALGGQYGTIQEGEKEWIQNVFNFNDIAVEEAMTRKSDVVAFPISSTNEEIKNIIIRSGLSRFPVYENDLNDVIGIMNAREFLINLSSDKPKPLRSIIRKAYFVPESIRADILFNDMQKKKLPIAIVIDEYGETSGIITMEDLIEEIVGNIYDEYDSTEEPEILKIADNLWKVNGGVYIDDLAEELNVELEEDESYDTIGGMVLSCLHTIPQDGSKLTVEVQNLHIDVIKIQNRRIEEVKLSILKEDTPVNSDNSEDGNENENEKPEKKRTGKVILEIGPDGQEITENITEDEKTEADNK